MINAAIANDCLSICSKDVFDSVAVETEGVFANVKLADDEVSRTLAERGRWRYMALFNDRSEVEDVNGVSFLVDGLLQAIDSERFVLFRMLCLFSAVADI